MSILDIICSAIRKRHQLSVRGKDDLDWRIVEPHIVYEAANGNILLDFYQTGGYSSSGKLPAWRRLLIAEIQQAEIISKQFNIRNAEGYNPTSDRYVKVICKV